MSPKTRQIIILLFSFTIVFQSCDRELKTTSSEINSNILDSIHLDLENKVYFVGPAIDSTSAEIEAGCDCCASRLLFFKDSSFIYISYCLEADSYFKGKYMYINNNLLLHYDSLEVAKLYDMASDVDTLNNDIIKPTFKISKHAPFTPKIKISMLKSKYVLSLTYKEGTDFGMEDKKTSMPDIINELRQDSIWYKLNLK